MDFELNGEQSAILEAVGQLLSRRAGVARAIELQALGRGDDVLHAELAEAGFLAVGRDEDAGLLEAVLVVEAVAEAAGTVGIAIPMILGALLESVEPESRWALVLTERSASPVRYLETAERLLCVDTDGVRVLALGSGDTAPVQSNFGYPLARLSGGALDRAQPLDVSATRVLDGWRLALAAETVGTMAAALACTVEYVKQRRQFGRAIGSFQAVQHRLAECAIEVEASRWLTREAAYHGAPAEAAATAASFAMTAADRVFAETHQLSGAIGFTREHDLHVWSMRLQALRLEMGGLRSHRRALADARWGLARP